MSVAMPVTDHGNNLGWELLAEIAKQDMIHAVPKRDAQGRHTGGFTFRWARNADEQLEGHLYHVLYGRGLKITPIPQTQGPGGQTKSVDIQ